MFNNVGGIWNCNLCLRHHFYCMFSQHLKILSLSLYIILIFPQPIILWLYKICINAPNLNSFLHTGIPPVFRLRILFPIVITHRILRSLLVPLLFKFNFLVFKLCWCYWHFIFCVFYYLFYLAHFLCSNLCLNGILTLSVN
jgi:hypothetical protein